MRIINLHRSLFILVLYSALTLSNAADSIAKDQALDSEGSTPEGLSKSDWQSIRAAHTAWEHSFMPLEGGGFQARNKAQQWTTKFDGRGFLAKPKDANWQWGLELRSYGFGTQQHSVKGQPAVKAEGQRLSYQWDTAVQEWFINDQRGLEHGFTVDHRPAGATPGMALEVVLGTRGTLKASVAADAQTVYYRDEAGAPVVNYSGLKVWDADGQILPSHFVQGPNHTIILRVEESSARYPITIDPIAQQAYLKASQVSADDFFGNSVAVSGNTVVVGAYGEDSSTTGINSTPDEGASSSGAAYVFVRSSGNWTQQAYLKASQVSVGDQFGISVAVDGDTVVVGAYSEDSSTTGINSTPNEGTTDSGATYVFVRSSGTWTQQAYLKASQVSVADYFGISVAVSGDTVVVGAYSEDSSTTGINSTPNEGASDSGATYVFVRSSGTWTQQAYLKASQVSGFDYFGISVAVSGDTVVVGANGEDSSTTGINSTPNEAASSSGAAYVFVRSSGTWTQQAYLKASQVSGFDIFGDSVAVDGDTVIVGAPYEASNTTGINSTPNEAASFAGAAYVFVRSNGTWTEQAYLKPSRISVNDFFEGPQFGDSVAVDGDTVVVGAPYEDSSTTGINSTPDDGVSDSGAAYVFVRSSGTWTQQAYLKASQVSGFDYFGISVAVSGDTVVVGANGEDSSTTGINSMPNEDAPAAGAVYIFSGLGPVVTNLPTVASASPSSGLSTGGTVVTLTGTNFTDATSVTFGGVAATSFSVISPTQITATTPPGVIGTASILVTTPLGTNEANTLYTYTNSPPTDITLTSASITENNAPGATVGLLAAVDADASQTHIFRLVSGTGDTDNASFSIDGTALKLSVAANFETKTSYSIRVRANDGAGEQYEEPFTITITNVVEGSSGAVSGNGVAISNGDSTPEATDNTDFGSIPLNGMLLQRTFDINNTGDQPLLLTGTPRVIIDGDHATDFFVITMPGASVTTTAKLQIVFKPTALGLRTARVTIPSNDLDDANFIFSIQGTAAPYAGGTEGGTIAFSALGYEVKQGTTQALVTIRRTGGTAATSVRVTSANGMPLDNRRDFEAATLDVDYPFRELTVNFAVNETSKTITVPLIPRTGLQPNRSFFLLLGDAGPNTQISDYNHAVVRIMAWRQPTITITAPLASPAVSAGLRPFVAAGLAVDAELVGITQVTVSLNGGLVQNATLGTASSTTRPWSLPIEPEIGTNTLTVTSYDANGMASIPVTRTFEYVRRYRLDLSRSPMGIINVTTALGSPVVTLSQTPTLTPLSIASGSPLTLRAVPATGQIFSHWSSLPNGVSAISSSFTYTMPEADIANPVTAVFVANPFSPSPGQGNQFYGLVRPEAGNSPGLDRVGWLTGTLTPTTGAFSGRLLYNGTTTSFSAIFMGNGSSIFNVAGQMQTTLSLANGDSLSLTYASGQIGVQVQRATVTLSRGNLERIAYTPTNLIPNALMNRTNPASGFYSLALPAQTQPISRDRTTYPQGDGFGTITLSRLGTFTAVGILADGTDWTASGGLVSGQQGTFFAQLLTPGMAARGGTLTGTFSGTLKFDATQADSDVTGDDLLWTRAAVIERPGVTARAVATQLYTSGWPQGIILYGIGALYQSTSTLQTTLGLSTSAVNVRNSELVISDGKLSPSIIVNATRIINSVITRVPATNRTFMLNANSTLGAINGSFTPNWTSPSTVNPTFRGILLQKGNAKGGYGFFQSNRLNDLNPEVGRVTLGPPAP
jgi:hypothetical protein